MESWKDNRLGSAIRGENPMVMVRMKSGFAVLGDNQFLPGYCVLLGYPKADSLNELTLPQRNQYLLDITLIGDAVIKVCKPIRVNYSILMNLDHYLHAHIEAHYDWESDEYKCRPSYFYPEEQKYGKEFEYNENKYGKLKRNITEALNSLVDQTYN